MSSHCNLIAICQKLISQECFRKFKIKIFIMISALKYLRHCLEFDYKVQIDFLEVKNGILSS